MATSTAKDTKTSDDLGIWGQLQKKKPRAKTLDVVLDDELAVEYTDLSREIDAERSALARLGGTAVADRQRALDAKVARLDDLRERMRDSIVTLRFVGIGRTAFEELVAQHPPTAKQKARAKEDNHPQPEWDEDTFPVAVVGASCKEPDLSVDAYEDEVDGRTVTRFPRSEQLFDTWNVGELQAATLAALEVNTQRRVVNLGEG